MSEIRGEGSNFLVPWVVGMSIPQKSDKAYHVFVLAHFVPFDIDGPLLRPGQTSTEVFNSSVIATRHLQILDNWEVIHECQDERDAKQIHKCVKQARESHAMMRALHGSIGEGNVTKVDTMRTGSQKARNVQAELLINAMRQCNWIKNREGEHMQVVVVNKL